MGSTKRDSVQSKCSLVLWHFHLKSIREREKIEAINWTLITEAKRMLLRSK
jgi:hypothetical protein